MCLLAPSPGRCTFVVCFLDGGRLRLFEDMCLRIHVPDVEKALIIVCDTRFYCDCTTLLPEADRFRQCLCMYLEQMGSAGVSRDAGLGRGCFVRCRSGCGRFARIYVWERGRRARIHTWERRRCARVDIGMCVPAIDLPFPMYALMAYIPG